VAFAPARGAELWGVSGAFGPAMRPSWSAVDPGRGTQPASGDGGMAVMPPQLRTPFDDLDPTAVLTAAEVAARMRVDARSVRRAAARGDLSASRACGLRILASDAATWWRSHAALVHDDDAASQPQAARAITRVAPRRRRGRSAARLPLPPRTGEAS
jgi:hypothetical protein